ncbi:MAG: hypothetical protein ACYSWU_04345 [Planctomycetota bacterium]
MAVIQQTAAEQWDLALSQLREVVPRAISHLQDLEAVAQTCYDSCEMGPEEWCEQSTDLEYFVVRDESTGVSPEDSVRQVFRSVRRALDAGDSFANFGGF